MIDIIFFTGGGGAAASSIYATPDSYPFSSVEMRDTGQLALL